MDGFVCILTGCNSLTGIGRASAYALAKKAPKAIYVTDISDNNLKDLADDITKTTGVECIPRRVDAASEKDIQAVVSHALEHYGRLDVFFANAGIARHFVLAEAECEDFMEMMRVNAWSVVAAIKCASAAMEITSETKPSSGGSIIATASVAGLRSGAGPVDYSASKAAVINICQSAAWRLRGKNIRVNAICPGLIETEMTKLPLGLANAEESTAAIILSASPLHRNGQPHEIGNMVAYLASNEASFVNGQPIVVDGGLSASHVHVPFFAKH